MGWGGGKGDPVFLPELPVPTGHRDLGCLCPPGEGSICSPEGSPHLLSLSHQETLRGNHDLPVGEGLWLCLGGGGPCELVRPTLHMFVSATGVLCRNISRLHTLPYDVLDHSPLS